jgi:beta-lactamase class A
MAHQRIFRGTRGALTATLTGVLLLAATAGAAPAAAATAARVRPAAPAPVACTSGRPGLAAKMSTDISAALKRPRSTTALAVQDRETGTRCGMRASQRFDSASVVKVTILAALLRDAQRTRRDLTKRETRLATAMITKSDNAAASALWRQLGPAKVRGFLKAAGMPLTTPGPGGAWGLTQVTAQDELRLMTLVTDPNSVLSDASRGFILERMRKVVASQRWGVTAGAPSDTAVQHKNGWLLRSAHGWRVHSIGSFTGKGRDYVISVLTDDNGTMKDGVGTIEAVARAVHKDLSQAPVSP